MFPVQPSKAAIIFAPVSATNGATQSGTFDCVGHDHAEIDLVLATADVVSNKPSVLKFQESDTTDASNYADSAGLVGGTDFTVVAGDTQNPQIVKFSIDLRKRKRYMKLIVSPRTTQINGANVNLRRSEVVPVTTTSMTVAQFVAV